MEAVGNWAERRNLPYAGYTDLAGKPEVLELVREAVEKVNADLASDPKLANAQISRFIVLHKELDADDEELTRTRKVRRRFIQEQVFDSGRCDVRRAQLSSSSKRWSSSRTAAPARLPPRSRCATPRHFHRCGRRPEAHDDEQTVNRSGSSFVPSRRLQRGLMSPRLWVAIACALVGIPLAAYGLALADS